MFLPLEQSPARTDRSLCLSLCSDFVLELQLILIDTYIWLLLYTKSKRFKCFFKYTSIFEAKINENRHCLYRVCVNMFNIWRRRSLCVFVFFVCICLCVCWGCKCMRLRFAKEMYITLTNIYCFQCVFSFGLIKIMCF